MPFSRGHRFGVLALLLGCATNASDRDPSAAPLRQASEAELAGAASDDGVAAQLAPDRACSNGEARSPASGLRIREIALYQAVKIPLFQDGAWVSNRPAMVVQGKRALVRVAVDTAPGYRPRTLRGVLTLQNDGEVSELVSERSVTASSTDQDESSAFGFDVPAAQIGPNTQLSVALTETSCGAAGAAEEGTRYPESGLQELGASATGTLKVVLVPVTANGRAPQYGERDLANLRDLLLSFYPVPEVELTVRSRPLVWSTSFVPDDYTTWVNVLNAIVRERANDGAPADTYYFGILQPVATMNAFCEDGCISGTAPQNTTVRPTQQVGVSVFFPNSGEFGEGMTIVHELGHSHGRGHAPCTEAGGSVSQVDVRFPHQGGLIGGWGWNSRTSTLVPPSYADVMSYCRKRWVSAYTYQGLAVRSQAVNSRAFVQLPAVAARWENLIAYADGRARWSGVMEFGQPDGDAESARVLDAAGNLIDEIAVVRTELSHTQDQFIAIPQPGKDWAKIALGDREIDLSEVAPPL